MKRIGEADAITDGDPAGSGYDLCLVRELFPNSLYTTVVRASEPHSN